MIHHHQILPVPPSSLIFRKAIKKRSHRRPARLLILFRSDPSYPSASVLRSFVLQRTEIGIHRRHQECIIIIITSRGRRKSTNYIVIAGTPTDYKMRSTCVIIFPLRNIQKLSKCSKCASEGGQMISGSNPARSPRDNSERRRCDDLALWENLPISLLRSSSSSSLRGMMGEVQRGK